MLSDEQIIARAVNGSHGDFRELMRRHQAAVYRLSYRILKRHEEAEDAVQETFLRVYQSLPSYSEQGRFWPWARRIAVNICLKKLSPEIPSEETEELIDESSSWDDPVQNEAIRRAEMEQMRKAVSGLPSTYRTVIVLRYEEELSYKEIADMLGEPVATVQVRLHRAKKMLAERLGVMNNELL